MTFVENTVPLKYQIIPSFHLHGAHQLHYGMQIHENRQCVGQRERAGSCSADTLQIPKCAAVVGPVESGVALLHYMRQMKVQATKTVVMVCVHTYSQVQEYSGLTLCVAKMTSLYPPSASWSHKDLAPTRGEGETVSHKSKDSLCASSLDCPLLQCFSLNCRQLLLCA